MTDPRSTVWLTFANTALAAALAQGPARIEENEWDRAHDKEALRMRVVKEHMMGNVVLAEAYADAMLKLWEQRFADEQPSAPSKKTVVDAVVVEAPKSSMKGTAK